MRAVEYSGLTQASLTGMDGFAPLGGGLTADPAIGGFRIVRTHHARGRWHPQQPATGTRLHASGSLSVLLVGALTIAVLGGPASCPCGPERTGITTLAGAGDARTLSRFAYTRASEIGLPVVGARFSPVRAAGGDDGALPKLAALVQSNQSAEVAGTSPISTAAITPAAGARDGFAGQSRLGLLPTKIEPLADTGPQPIRLATAAPADDMMIPTLPMVEIETPDAPNPVESETQDARDTQTARERTVPKRRARNAQHVRKARSSVDPASVMAKKYARAPRWAQQMFDNPWQSKAFSYIQ